MKKLTVFLALTVLLAGSAFAYLSLNPLHRAWIYAQLPFGSSTGSIADADYAMGNLRGHLVLDSYIYEATPEPFSAFFGVSPELRVKPFTTGAAVGLFEFTPFPETPSDRSRPAFGPPELVHKLIGCSPTEVAVDMNDNGSCDSGETRGNASSSGVSFSNSSTGMLIPGRYALRLFSPVELVIVAEAAYCLASISGPNQSIERRAAYIFRELIMPHVVIGRSDALARGGAAQAGATAISTLISLSNPTGIPVDSTLAFFGQDGESAEVSIEGETGTTFPVTVPAYTTQTVALDAVGPFRTLWGRVRGENLTVATTFRTVQENGSASVSGGTPQGTLLGEAGLSAGPQGFIHVLGVEENSAGSTTAFAMVNLVPGTANITATLRDSNREEVATRTLQLAAMNQTAQFVLPFFGMTLDQLVPAGSGSQSFNGSVEFRSDNGLVVLSLQTIGGFQQSSLPSGTLAAQ